MKVFYDVLTDDELLSDSYKSEQVFDGTGLEVRARLVVKGAADVDIGNSFSLLLQTNTYNR